MTKKEIKVRDFIYVDVDKLYSLYSQVFEGVSEKIVQSYIDSLTAKDVAPTFSLGNKIQEQAVELSNRKESKILYDHMYTQLEDKLEDSITEIENISATNYYEKLSKSFMIKVSGKMEIEDYERISFFCKEINNIGEAIAYFSVFSDDIADFKENIKALEEKINLEKDRNKKATNKAQLNHLKNQINPKKLAKSMGISQDEKIMEYINKFIQDFYTEGVEFTINPQSINDDMVFRGIINQDWLRVNSSLLRSLYGGFVNSTWTMVGQITLMPEPAYVKNNNTQTQIVQETENNDYVSFRDPIRDCFGAMREVESFFLESKKRIELIVSPLAIYRENTIKVKDSKTKE